jgi:RNA polymerase sigma-70 factor (ECF subfamily)
MVLPELQSLRAGGHIQRAAFGTLYDALAGRLRGWFQRHGSALAEAEDLTQETFVKVARSIGEFRGEQGQLAGWIWTIARNLMLDARRAAGRRPTLDLQDEATEALLPADDAPTALQRIAAERRDECVRRGFSAFAKSYPDRAQCLSWLVTDTLDTGTIAELIGRTPGATREFLSQCRKKLRPFIEHCLELAEA